MKIILNTEELQKALTAYLKANAAVEVGEITFSAKKNGVIAEVETTLLDSVQAVLTPVKESTMETVDIPKCSVVDNQEVAESIPIPEYVPEDTIEFTPKPEELVDDEVTEEEETPEDIISEKEATIPNPAFDFDEEADKFEQSLKEPEVAEVEPLMFEIKEEDTSTHEVPVLSKPVSIAELFGSSYGS
jgi:hypothetical protein